MYCPYCRHSDSKVLDSRTTDDGASIRRRRQCPSCERRFTTIEQMQLVVVKRSGVVEPFNRDKVISGVRKACKGRPVSEDQLARLGQLVEDSLRTLGQPEIPADEVGVAILGPLRELDQVAYLRFASVYRQFRSVEDSRSLKWWIARTPMTWSAPRSGVYAPVRKPSRGRWPWPSERSLPTASASAM